MIDRPRRIAQRDHVARAETLRDDDAPRGTSAELDLDGVEPTTHVIELENVLRPDEPRPSWPREAMLERAPDPAAGAYRVPSPQA